MSEDLRPATLDDVADALAFALRFSGRKRVHNADEIMANIVADRLVAHLDRAGFVIMRKPPSVGAATAWRGPAGSLPPQD